MRRHTKAVLAAGCVLAALLPAPPAAAANQAPKIRTAKLVDSDGDGFANKLVLRYSERIRHRRDTDGRYPFKVPGHQIVKVNKGSRRNLVIVLKDNSSDRETTVSYTQTRRQPVRDFAGKQAPKQTFSGVLPHVYFVTIDPAPVNGTIDSTTPGISCGSAANDCSHAFKRGTLLTLTATPDNGGSFDAWSLAGVCGAGSMCTLRVNKDWSLSAAFDPPGGGLLTVSPAGMGVGTITSDDGNINCSSLDTSSGCSYDYPPSEHEVVLTALPSVGTILEGWTGCDQVSGNTCTVVLDGSAKGVTPAFKVGM